MFLRHYENILRILAEKYGEKVEEHDEERKRSSITMIILRISSIIGAFGSRDPLK